jgi:hypothetical protein
MPPSKLQNLPNFALNLKTYDTHNINKYSAQTNRKFHKKKYMSFAILERRKFIEFTRSRKLDV